MYLSHLYEFFTIKEMLEINLDELSLSFNTS